MIFRKTLSKERSCLLLLAFEIILSFELSSAISKHFSTINDGEGIAAYRLKI